MDSSVTTPRIPIGIRKINAIEKNFAVGIIVNGDRKFLSLISFFNENKSAFGKFREDDRSK